MSLLFFGYSHLTCIEESHDPAAPGAIDAAFHYLTAFAEPGSTDLDDYDLDRIRSIVADAAQARLLCISIRGNEHFTTAVFDVGLSPAMVQSKVTAKVKNLSLPWLKFFADLGRPTVLIPPPPPLASEHITKHPRKLREKLTEYGVASAEMRLAAWKHHVDMLRAEASRLGLAFLELPSAVYSNTGLLAPEFAADDPTHGNKLFGAKLLTEIYKIASAPIPAPQPVAERAPVPPAVKLPGRHARPQASSTSSQKSAQANVSKAVHKRAPKNGADGAQQKKGHPYKGLPEQAFWRESVASLPAASLDPVSQVPFHIGKTDRVATAGSCFAQHISKRLRKGGFHFLITEQPAKGQDAEAESRGFYDFSARYGNIYTSRQLVQLFDRAYGFFTPVDDHWTLEGGRVCDPFRPRIEAGGFADVDELRADRERHLRAVRTMFEELDIFVFTLGLTECWISRLDGAAYPLAPGVSGGEFDPAKHAFVNLTVDEITRDLQAFIAKLRMVNPKARLILTVSPVPLAATYADEHVLVATTYSKSVLRVAAEMTERAHDGVLYFPSYEIITGAYARGHYFAEDLRTVTDEGVSHVMQVFMNRMVSDDGTARNVEAELAAIDDLGEAVCDEVLLAQRH